VGYGLRKDPKSKDQTNRTEIFKMTMMTKITASLLATTLLVACGGTTTPAATVAAVQTPEQIAAAAKLAADTAAAKAAAEAAQAAADKAVADAKAAADKLAADKAAADAAAAAAKLLEFDTMDSSLTTIEGSVASFGFTDAGTFPTTGSATFEGFASLDLDTGTFGADSDEIIGTMEITANFAPTATEALSGSISDLAFEDDSKITGSINLSNSVFDRSAGRFFGSGNNFEADLTGVLTDDEGESVLINGELDGDFRSAGASDARSALDGFINGTIVTNGGSTSWNGEFTTLPK
jgi:hypothetical protein